MRRPAHASRQLAVLVQDRSHQRPRGGQREGCCAQQRSGQLSSAEIGAGLVQPPRHISGSQCKGSDQPGSGGWGEQVPAAQQDGCAESLGGNGGKVGVVSAAREVVGSWVAQAAGGSTGCL